MTGVSLGSAGALYRSSEVKYRHLDAQCKRNFLISLLRLTTVQFCACETLRAAVRAYRRRFSSPPPYY